ncbi:TonB-dependent siderophore receptor [Lusitaniella coriacea]|uniref:TonB-dependent siderophore receptor n=1 Tax=Lusitaniella coriacea TaxID=1983105 RepID=UPI003CF094D8
MAELGLKSFVIASFTFSSALVARPALAQFSQINRVQLETVEGGIEIVLESTEGTLPQFLTSRDGNTWIAEAIDTQLAQGASLEQLNPAPGIESVSVQSSGANSVRIVVVGTASVPSVDIFASSEGVTVLSVRTSGTADTPDETPQIEIFVVAEDQGDDNYFIPRPGTATRIETPILQIPQSVQGISQQVIEDQRTTRLDEALNNVSGVVADTTEGTGFRFAIRGFERANLLQDGFTLSASDGSFRSGLALPEIANLDRIEVLRGPASILYGDLNPGGVINLVTKQPLPDPFYEIELQAGTLGLFRPRIDFSGPLTEDGDLRYRLNALYQNDSGFRNFEQNVERFFIAPMLAWDISEQTNLTLELQYLNDERPYDTGTIAVGTGLAEIPRDRILNEPTDFRAQDFLILGANLNHQFNDNWLIRNAVRYARQTENGRIAIPFNFNETAGILTRLDASVDNLQESIALQTNLIGKFNTGSVAHEVLLGLDLGHNSTSRVTEGDFRTPLPLNIFNPAYNAFPRSTARFLPALDEFVNTNRLGLYLQDRVSFTEELTFLAGLRFDLIDQDLTSGTVFRGPVTVPGVARSRQDSSWTPRFGLVYQPLPELSLYASYSRSFRPNSGTAVSGEFLESERGEGYEIGAKAELLGGNLFASVAYFNITKQNIATPDPNARTLFNAFIAAGEQNSQGFEFDLRGQLTPGWDFIASYSYTDAKVTEDTVIPVGNRLIGIPEHSLSLWTKYTIQEGSLEGLGFGLGLNYASQRQGDLNSSFQLDDYLIANAAIYYNIENWGIAINFKNLLNTNYARGVPISRIRNIEIGEPFTVLFSLSYEF